MSGPQYLVLQRGVRSGSEARRWTSDPAVVQAVAIAPVVGLAVVQVVAITPVIGRWVSQRTHSLRHRAIRPARNGTQVRCRERHGERWHLRSLPHDVMATALSRLPHPTATHGALTRATARGGRRCGLSSACPRQPPGFNPRHCAGAARSSRRSPWGAIGGDALPCRGAQGVVPPQARTLVPGRGG